MATTLIEHCVNQ